ncbi:MAG: phosphoribosylaminoimidazolesuccinocarboxamide synthase [Chloroflexia bacterium]
MTDQTNPLPAAVTMTDFPLPLYARGKVRDTYDLGDRLLMTATDRLSAFDSVLPNGIPGRGIVLTQLSAFWFERTREIMPNHFLSIDPADFPFDTGGWTPEQREMLEGRSMLVRLARRIDIECIVRGYLAGSAWAEYKQNGGQEAGGVHLPGGLVESQELPEPIFTPTTKAETGHDEPISFDRLIMLVGGEMAESLRAASLRIYREAAAYARERGILIADTKMEFGLLDDKLTLIDELLTPDSSRFWDAALYSPGSGQPSLDKQYVRDWLLASGWNREPPTPVLPPDVVARTAAIYREAYDRLTQKGRFTVRVHVTLKPVVNDPQGLAVLDALGYLGYSSVGRVRVGKVIDLDLAAPDAEAARAAVEEMARRLLANPVIEQFDIEEPQAISGSQASK